MRNLFAQDKRRFEKFHIALPGLTYDYSKNRITEETLRLLTALAEECDLQKQIQSMLAGEKINVTEGRAALHMALRSPIAADQDADFIKHQRAVIKRICAEIHNNKNITDIVHIGTGGSDLGPRMICHALAAPGNSPRAHFVNNIDGNEILDVLATLKPENAIFILASKAFSTAEALQNAATARIWLEKSTTPEKAAEHFYAVTANMAATESFGIKPGHILPMQHWIGGRFSLWSAIGITIAVTLGLKTFNQLLDGAAAMDRHFLTAPYEKNIPVMMALLSVWYRNFWDFRAHAVIPYASRLNFFASYIQQLEMESNGKSMSRNGEIISYPTAPIILGDVGTNAQHAFFQFLHQGSDIIPCDLIAFKNSSHNLSDHHTMLLASALAQGEALMEGSENKTAPHRACNGNRPSNTFILEKMDARHLGMLIAAYEHKIFVQGVLWNINSFDQWGVELGKTLAKRLIIAMEAGKAPENLDSSTAGLLGIIASQKD